MMDLTNILQNRQLPQVNKEEIANAKENKIKEEYKALQAIAKSRNLKITKFRKFKVIDPLTDKSWMQMVIGLEDYDPKKDKHVYLSTFNVNEKDTPRAYGFLYANIDHLSAEWRE